MDFNTLLALARHYNEAGTFASGDLNGDGTVDFSDLLLLAHNYGHPLSSISLLGASMGSFGPVSPALDEGGREWPRYHGDHHRTPHKSFKMRNSDGEPQA